MKTLRSYSVWVAAICAAGCLVTGAQAASVPVGGYTNAFGAVPPVADWSFLSIAGGSGDITDTTVMDGAVQGVAPGAITTVVGTDAGNPPALNANALWSSTGFYVQTRPTNVRGILLMCTLVNNLGSAASSIRIQYDFTSVVAATEEVPAQRVYYNLTGNSNSWIQIPSLSIASPTCCYVSNLIANVTLASNWNAGATLYLVFADDNGSGSPDVAYQIDNFSFQATPATPTPIVITSQPADLTVVSGQAANFTVGASGFPISYQWYKSLTKIAGATSPTYTINPTTINNAGQYFCVLSNQVSGSVTSRVATLNVLVDNFPPTILSALSPLAGTSVQVTYSETTTNRNTNFVITVTGTTNRLTITGVSPTVGSVITIATVKRVPGTSYTLTVNNVRDTAGNVIAPNTQVPIAVEDSLIAMTNTWRLETNGVDLGTAWRVPGYNDSSWATGVGAFDGKNTGNRQQVGGVGIGTFLPLNSTTFPGSDIPTYYFRTHFNFPGYTNGGILRLTHLLDDCAVFYLNGAEIYRWEYPNPTPSFGYGGNNAVGDAAQVGPIDLFVGSLLTGDNVLAVEVHQINGTSSDITFGASIVGHSEAIPSGPVTITNQPASITVTESQPVSFQVGLMGSLPYRFQWYTNAGGTSSVFTAVSGATNPVYTIPIVPLSLNGTRIRVTVTNTFTNAVFGVLSSNAVLTVIPDTVRPELVQAYANSTLDAIVVSFSERVTGATATNVSLYRITNSTGGTVAISGATLSDGTNVTLVLSTPLSQTNRYILRVSGIRDISLAGNLILPNSGVTIGETLAFITLDLFDDSALWFFREDFVDLGTAWRANNLDEVVDGWAQAYSLLGHAPNPGLLPVQLNYSLATTFPDNDAYPCYYFRKHFLVPGPTNGMELRLRHVIDDGSVMYLNNQEVLRFNMPPGPVDFFTTASGAATASIVGPITLATTNLHTGDNILAAELHQDSPTSGDSAFAVELSGFIPSTQLTDFIPRLSINRSNANVRITWTVAGYTLEQANTVTGVWANASGVVSGATNSLVTQTTNTTRFFRLRQ